MAVHVVPIVFCAAIGAVASIISRVQAQPVQLPPISITAQAAGAVVTREGGFEFVTVGHAGNAEIPAEFQTFPTPTPGMGRVDYAYRISRTEVTYGQYFDFVRAYAPYWSGSDSVEFLGLGIRVSGDIHEPGSYVLRPGWESAPAEMGWRFAARLCNWLQNDRGTAQSAFQTGAYDATTFTPDPPAGGLNDNASRLPGARFFIPTQSEWTKAMYYDPNRFGRDQGGYWQYPTTSDTPPIVGLPGTPGAQTDTNLGFTNPPFPVASYPAVMSPWALLDGSGGTREWLEGRRPLDSLSRLFRGTQQFGDSVFDDQIGLGGSGFVGVNGTIGLRIATSVPPPATWGLWGLAITSRRRRR